MAKSVYKTEAVKIVHVLKGRNKTTATENKAETEYTKSESHKGDK